MFRSNNHYKPQSQAPIKRQLSDISFNSTNDEPMVPSDMINTVNNPQIIQDLITRAHARQVDHQVNSFLAVHASFDGLLLNFYDVLLLRNVGETPQPYPNITPRRTSLP